MNAPDDERIVIGTLGLGKQFSMHAALLAHDLLVHHPDIPFYIFTDYPHIFAEFENVVAIKHHSTGVRRCYHDKRHVLKHMLNVAPNAVLLDADLRLLKPINFDELIIPNNFITCLHSKNLEQKLELAIEQKERKATSRLFITRKMCEKAEVSIDQVVFLQESLLVFQRIYGDVEKFFNCWDFCARYSALYFYEYSEGSSIGIAAEYVGAMTGSLDRNPAWLFKDQLVDYKYKSPHEIILSKNLIQLRKAIENIFAAYNIPLVKNIGLIYRYTINLIKYILSSPLIHPK